MRKSKIVLIVLIATCSIIGFWFCMPEDDAELQSPIVDRKSDSAAQLNLDSNREIPGKAGAITVDASQPQTLSQDSVRNLEKINELLSVRSRSLRKIFEEVDTESAGFEDRLRDRLNAMTDDRIRSLAELRRVLALVHTDSQTAGEVLHLVLRHIDGISDGHAVQAVSSWLSGVSSEVKPILARSFLEHPLTITSEESSVVVRRAGVMGLSSAFSQSDLFQLHYLSKAIGLEGVNPLKVYTLIGYSGHLAGVLFCVRQEQRRGALNALLAFRQMLEGLPDDTSLAVMKREVEIAIVRCGGVASSIEYELARTLEAIRTSSRATRPILFERMGLESRGVAPALALDRMLSLVSLLPSEELQASGGNIGAGFVRGLTGIGSDEKPEDLDYEKELENALVRYFAATPDEKFVLAGAIYTLSVKGASEGLFDDVVRALDADFPGPASDTASSYSAWSNWLMLTAFRCSESRAASACLSLMRRVSRVGPYSPKDVMSLGGLYSAVFASCRVGEDKPNLNLDLRSVISEALLSEAIFELSPGVWRKIADSAILLNWRDCGRLLRDLVGRTVLKEDLKEMILGAALRIEMKLKS